jgi:hypothetical protein
MLELQVIERGHRAATAKIAWRKSLRAASWTWCGPVQRVPAPLPLEGSGGRGARPVQPRADSLATPLS